MSNQVSALKSIALAKLVEAGVIERKEDGSVDMDGFERFWVAFERNLMTALANQLGAELKKRGKDPVVFVNSSGEVETPDLDCSECEFMAIKRLTKVGFAVIACLLGLLLRGIIW